MAWRMLGQLLQCIKRGQIGRWLCIFFCAVAVAEFLLLNIVVIMVYRTVNSEIAEITADPTKPFFDKLQNNRKFSNFISDAKKNGIFTLLLQETLERLYIIHEGPQWKESKIKRLVDEKGRHMKDISFIGIDVSHSREATYIYSRIASKKDFPYHFMVVDIGTNDGFISSNSFNFIQWGWDAVLVEPQATEIRSAQSNIRSYIDKYNDGEQTVKLIQAAIGSRDGTVEFVITKATQGAESHVKTGEPINTKDDTVVHVPSVTVKTLAAKNNIPKNFGLLSIDAEGVGAEILRQWISQGFRPAYIIFEHLHRQEPLIATMNYLKEHGYHYLGARGWNLIFEHYDLDSGMETA